MKRYGVLPRVLLILAATGCSPLQAAEPHQPRILWQGSAPQAVSQARQAQLPILVYVTADSCGHCQKMEQQCWNHPQIVEMVEEGFLPLKLDAKRDEKLVAAIGVRALPTTLIYGSDGQVLTGAAGYLAPGQVAGLLRSVERTPDATTVTNHRPR